MAVFERDGVCIRYEEHGQGFPVLLLAPGGLRSRIEAWSAAPYDPIEALKDRHRVIAMDQRNAGASTGPIEADHGWANYTADQLALLDHLGVDQFAAVGMCIGGPYVVRLARAAPQRLCAGVLLQPIGVSNNRDTFFAMFDAWMAEQRSRHPEADDRAWAAFRRAMFGNEAAFMFGATEDDVRTCQAPLLVTQGDDVYHPATTARRVVELAPRARLIERWKTGADLEALRREVDDFLREHTA